MSLAMRPPSKESKNLAKILATQEAQVRLLVEKGADPLLEDDQGRTALDLARNRGIPALEDLFESLANEKGSDLFLDLDESQKQICPGFWYFTTSPQ